MPEHTLTDPSPALPGELPPEVFAQIQSLYDEGACLKAYELGNAVRPFEKWRGPYASILGGRIALNLGASRLAFRQHVRAFHDAPDRLKTQAYYLETFLAMRGPAFAWEKFRAFEKAAASSVAGGPEDEGWEYLFTLGARICGHFREFERAKEYIKIADKKRSAFPWLLVEQAALAAMQEHWEQAVELSRRALELRPWYRPAAMQLAHCLHTLNRDEESLQLLKEATLRLESLPVLHQLASLQMDLEQYSAAMETLQQAERFSPIADKTNQNWIAAQACRAACASGKSEEALRSASRLEDDYHKGLAERLKTGSAQSRRVQLTVPFIQQFRLTCVPATLTMLCRFWHVLAEHVDVAEAICYDGTPSHKARRWAETNGLYAREFTLNWDLAVALLDRGIPCAVYTAEATNGHVHVLAGYDQLRRTFIFRNPSFPQIQEAHAEKFLKHYASTGPAAMVVVPKGQENLLEGLNFPDADLFDQLRHTQEALELHDRANAQAHFAQMQSAAPARWLTLTAGRALNSYDTNAPALLECLNQLLALFPTDANLSLAKLGMMRETGRREERLEYLREICGRKEVDAVFRQQLAEELMADARQYPEARLELRKSLRAQPLNSYMLTSLANLYWKERRFDESLDLYRFAACLEETREPAATTYFSAANARRQTETALAFLQERWKRHRAKSPGPFITWFNALRQAGRAQEGLNHLDEELRNQPSQGELHLAAAEAFARHGRSDRAEECLAAAEGHVHRASWLKVKADLAKFRTDSKSAVALLREVLQLEPLSMPVHRTLAWVLAESEGRDAALKHLEEMCRRFPHHYQLHQLWADWARGAGPEQGEQVARKLVEVHPADVWARRQLALALGDGGRFDEALVEAEEAVRLAPEQAGSLGTRAHVKLNLGRTAEAQEDFRQAVRLAADYGAAIHGLVNSFHTLTERQAALAFVEQELLRQVVFGEGLSAYREAARLNLEPEALLRSLRLALRERPDLAAAWSVVIHQLADMVELDEAQKLAQNAAERFPLLEQAWLDLATVQRLCLDPNGEKAALEQAMRVSPASSSGARALAFFFERQGDITRARQLLEEACARSPLDPFSHGSLAMLLWRQGERPAALERMRHALALDPNYEWGWQTLGSWGTATGQPGLAEELAQSLVVKRPGEVRSLLVLVRLLAGGKRLPEALQVVEQALRKFERAVEAHDLRAQILAALGRHAEADAACEPDIFAGRIPAALRASRARLEAQRGNLVSASERMQSVLQENPGYGAGWQNLADWLWQRGMKEEAVNAITNLRRLEPLNPVPLGYRASMKLQKNDRRGARSDLERALKYDPAYSFASLTLFDLQLADKDLEGARRTFELIQRYVGGEKAAACEVKLRAHGLKSVIVRPSYAQSHPARQDLEQALARLKELCASKEADQHATDLAINALIEARQTRQVEQVLEEMILLPDANPAVGVWWMRRRIARRKWNCTRAVNQLALQSLAARRAVTTLIESLGQQGGPNYLALLGKRLQRRGRGLALRWIARRHRPWLRADNDGWGSMGYGLLTLGRYRAAGRWMSDWSQRPGLKMWMMLNLALALRGARRWQEAGEVLAFAITLPERDQTFPRVRLLLAMELAVAGHTQEAAEHFHELGATGWNRYMEMQYRLTKGVLTVQQAAPAEKRKVFRSERAAIRTAMGAQRARTFGKDYRRCVMRMAKDAGQRWACGIAWLGF